MNGSIVFSYRLSAKRKTDTHSRRYRITLLERLENSLCVARRDTLSIIGYDDLVAALMLLIPNDDLRRHVGAMLDAVLDQILKNLSERTAVKIHQRHAGPMQAAIRLFKQ